MYRAYYFSLFYTCLVALAAFSIAHAAPSSLLLRIILGLSTIGATALLVLVLVDRPERAWSRSSVQVRRLAKKLKRNIRLRRPRPGFNQAL